MGERGWLVEVAAENATLRAENDIRRQQHIETCKTVDALRAELAAAKAENAKLRTTLEALVENARQVQEQRDALKAALEPSDVDADWIRLAKKVLRRRAGLEVGG